MDRGRQTFLSRVLPSYQQCMMYEDPAAQAAALETVNREELEEKALTALAKEGKFTPTKDEVEHAFLFQLLRWFKESFRWVDQPMCSSCGSKTVRTGNTTPTAEERKWRCGNVELFRCPSCYKDARFPRINDPKKLLETRCGRCGEWANCFTLYCRAFGYKARLILDFEDHVWTECYLSLLGRWVHADPCEGIMDKPLLYEHGWGKKLSYCIALSHNGVHDVTKRYTRKWPEVLSKRTITSEDDVKEALMFLTNQIRADLPAQEWEELMLLDQLEEEEISASYNEGSSPEENLPGRVTGSEEWRTLRGETGIPSALKRKVCPVRVFYDEHVKLIREAVGSLFSDIMEADASLPKVVLGLKALHEFLSKLKAQPFRKREVQLDPEMESAWLGHANDETIALLLKSVGLVWTLREDGLFWVSLDDNPVFAALSLPVALDLLDKLTKNQPHELIIKWLVHGIRLCNGKAVSSGEELPLSMSSAAFDGLVSTKWEEPAGARGGWIIYHLPKDMSQTLAAYEITSANDSPERDPCDWLLEGSNDDGVTWKTLDSQQGQVFQERFLSKIYEIHPESHFLCNSFRLRVMAVKDSSRQNRLQLASIDFIALKP